MRKLLLLSAFLLQGCAAFTDPSIQCWYASAATQTVGEPWYVLHGRTGKFRDDVYGPMFKNAAELEAYVTTNHLKLCGSAQ